MRRPPGKIDDQVTALLTEQARVRVLTKTINQIAYSTGLDRSTIQWHLAQIRAAIKGGRVYQPRSRTPSSKRPSAPYSSLNEQQRTKAKARSHAKMALKRGQFTREPCRKCGVDQAEMHHPDYSKPLQVIWLCRKCHMDFHMRGLAIEAAVA